MKLLNPCCAAIIIASAFFNGGWAVPAKPGLTPFTQADGSIVYVRIMGDEHCHYYLSEDGDYLVETDGFLVAAEDGWQVTRRSPRSVARKTSVGLYDDSFPSTGSPKVLVVVVDYPNATFSIDDPYDYFNRMLSEEGFSDYDATGSAADYFTEASYGLFTPQFDLYGPLTLANNRSYYGANDYYGDDEYAWMMAVEACEQLDDSVDFSQYDCDGDGYIDNIFVFYAGLGENNGGASYTVWPHSWYISEATDSVYIFDGVQLDRYACSNEWNGSEPDGVGTFVHEFSHVLGLPDLYNTGTTSSPFTLGSWDVLDTGSYNNDSRTPPMYSIFERYALGWIEPYIIEGEDSIALAYISDGGDGCVIPTADDGEFFLLENRQKSRWDGYIPGHGMLIWHIDYDEEAWYNNEVNNDATHQRVDLEEADDKRTAGTRAGDSFPGTGGITSFTDDTSPGMLTWDGTALGLPITDITEADSIITFNVAKSTQAGISPVITDDESIVTIRDINLPKGMRVTIKNGKTYKWMDY